MTLYDYALLFAALGSATIGGLFFAFSAFIMRALAARPAGEGMAAMVSINRVILRSLFMVRVLRDRVADGARRRLGVHQLGAGRLVSSVGAPCSISSAASA